MFISNTFLIVVSFSDVEGSVYDSMNGAIIMLGRQGVDVLFYFEVDFLPAEEGIGKVK